jgi:hypothetical protein
MLTKCCAAWLVVLTFSPFTAPFMVCELSAVIGQTIDRDARPANDLEEWFVNGAAMLDFPVAPAAGELKLASCATLGAADSVEMVPATPLAAPPAAPIPFGRAPTLAVLRL